MSFTDDVLSGLAVLLAAGGVGTWRPTGTYLPSDATPVFLAAVPSAPDRMLALSAYGVSDDGNFADDVLGVQVRSRAGRDDRMSVDSLDDAVFTCLHGLGPLTLSTGVRVLRVKRASTTPLGADENGRPERSSNYYVTAFRPAPNRL